MAKKPSQRRRKKRLCKTEHSPKTNAFGKLVCEVCGVGLVEITIKKEGNESN